MDLKEMNQGKKETAFSLRPQSPKHPELHTLASPPRTPPLLLPTLKAGVIPNNRTRAANDGQRQYLSAYYYKLKGKSSSHSSISSLASFKAVSLDLDSWFDSNGVRPLQCDITALEREMLSRWSDKRVIPSRYYWRPPEEHSLINSVRQRPGTAATCTPSRAPSKSFQVEGNTTKSEHLLEFLTGRSIGTITANVSKKAPQKSQTAAVTQEKGTCCTPSDILNSTSQTQEDEDTDADGCEELIVIYSENGQNTGKNESQGQLHGEFTHPLYRHPPNSKSTPEETFRNSIADSNGNIIGTDVIPYDRGTVWQSGDEITHICEHKEIFVDTQQQQGERKKIERQNWIGESFIISEDGKCHNSTEKSVLIIEELDDDEDEEEFHSKLSQPRVHFTASQKDQVQIDGNDNEIENEEKDSLLSRTSMDFLLKNCALFSISDSFAKVGGSYFLASCLRMANNNYSTRNINISHFI